MDAKEIEDILETTGAYLKEGHFKLVSGNHSDSYVHVRCALAHPGHASRIGKLLADEFQGQGINVVAAFTVSGIALAKSVAEHLKARLVLGERKEKKIIFASDCVIEEGDNVLVVDDVLTTGELIHQILDTIRNETQAVSKGVGVVVNRSKEKADFGVRIVSLITDDLNLWPPEICPKCEQDIPLTDLSSPNADVFGVLYSLSEEVRPVVASAYEDILTQLEEGKLDEGKPLEEILAFWTKLCRMAWEKFLQRKRDGLTLEMQEQLSQEFSAIKNAVARVIHVQPVRVEERAIVYEPSKMEKDKIYPVELHGKLYLVRKTGENIVETYEMEQIE